MSGDRPTPDPWDWYDDTAWATGDDAHRVTFDPQPETEAKP